MSADDRIAVTINGAPKMIAPGTKFAGLVEWLGLNPAKVAVERNRIIVPRSTLSDVRVEAGDEIEIITFVGGG